MWSNESNFIRKVWYLLISVTSYDRLYSRIHGDTQGTDDMLTGQIEGYTGIQLVG